LVTTTPRLALAVVTADCVPVLLGDARAGVVAAAHAGRVGAQKGVVARTVEAMVRLGAHVDDISALLGPAVSGRNYEVPEEMASAVEASLPGSRTTTARGTPGLDLRAGIARQLTALGVTAVDIDPRCTVDDRNLFSHRRDAPTGRLASLVWME
jgi:YfiH family protein